jgi:signal transduction histidine kinase
MSKHHCVLMAGNSLEAPNLEALQFLVNAGPLLNSSLDYAQVLKNFTELTVPHLADWCIIHVIDPEKKTYRTEIAHADSSMLPLLTSMKNNCRWEGLVPKTRLCVEATADLLRQVSTSEEHYQILTELNPKSAMVIPLLSREKILGVMNLFSSRIDSYYREIDLGIAETFAKHASIALDNALAFHESQDALKLKKLRFAIASHELKSPMTSLQLLLELALKEFKEREGAAFSSEKLSQLLHRSKNQLGYLDRVVENLFDLSQIESETYPLQLEAIDLSQLITEVTNQFSEQASRCKCELILALGNPAEGLWDKTKIEQVLINLISNALKYAPGSPIRISSTLESSTAIISIEDRGPGIPKDKHFEIFNEFKRLRPEGQKKGLGLGLFITREIIQAHSGSIQVDSEVGRGSKFIIKLPCFKAALPSSMTIQPDCI